MLFSIRVEEQQLLEHRVFPKRVISPKIIVIVFQVPLLQAFNLRRLLQRMHSSGTKYCCFELETSLIFFYMEVSKMVRMSASFVSRGKP